MKGDITKTKDSMWTETEKTDYSKGNFRLFMLNQVIYFRHRQKSIMVLSSDLDINIVSITNIRFYSPRL